ncbi:DUF6090 family protein [Psychroserpens sp.]|uniref:DUF6090 family protein n=1 Tax=Psychroserpens sp. TaxID=2020870 RepID=UPI00385E54AB
MKKYILYAIGEIILVVIGILIALAINDRNTKIADEKELERIITLIEVDLQNDLVEAKDILKSTKDNYKLLTNVLYNSKFKDSIEDCVDCRYIMTQGQVASFNSKGYELLTRFNKEVKTTNKAVDSLLNFYEKYDRNFFDFQNEIILNEVVDNMKYLRDNFDWYSEYYIGSTCNDQCLEYFQSSDYINRLTYYEALFFDNYLYLIDSYQSDINKMIHFLDLRKS